MESYWDYPYHGLMLNLEGVGVTLLTAGYCLMWMIAGNIPL
ncbi:hypothetical protein [Microcoleus sp. FACHB-SPT15]|nr:hypothetical protein [Microcoleus sp. FACHB-SPT15]